MNFTHLQPYLDSALAGRDWSWSLVGLVYIIVGLFIRGLFLKPLLRHAKELEKKPYRDFRSAYLGRSLWGWVFFFITFLILIGLWTSVDNFPISENEALLILAGLASYVLSIIFHIGAIAVAAIVSLKKSSRSN